MEQCRPINPCMLIWFLCRSVHAFLNALFSYGHWHVQCEQTQNIYCNAYQQLSSSIFECLHSPLSFVGLHDTPVHFCHWKQIFSHTSVSLQELPSLNGVTSALMSMQEMCLRSSTYMKWEPLLHFLHCHIFLTCGKNFAITSAVVHVLSYRNAKCTSSVFGAFSV